MTVVYVVVSAVLGLAALLLLVRLTIGPTILDRSVALDVIMAVTICGLGVHMAWTGSTYTLPVLLVLSMAGFVGSVSIARYASGSDDVDADADDEADRQDADRPEGGR